MPHLAKVSLKRWKNEFPSTISNNFDSISSAFENLKLLYPELGKLHPDLGVLEFALGNVDEFWVISLDVYEKESESGPTPDDLDLVSFNPYPTNGKKRGGGEEAGTGSRLDTLISFPVYQTTNDGSPGGSSTSGSSSTNRTAISSMTSSSGHSPTTIPDLVTPKPNDKIRNSKAPVLEPIDLPPLLGFDPEDNEYEESVRHKLANGIMEQHVVGLAFAVPTTIHNPELFEEGQEDSPPDSSPKKSIGITANGGGIKSYDIGLLLQFDPIHERLLELGIPCSSEEEENYTKDAIFQILLDLEPVLDPSVLQFQTLMVPSVDWLHDKTLEAFVSMGFFREGKGKVLNFRGYEELVTVLSLRMGEWEHYKHQVRRIPEGKKNKGKGKERSVADESSHLNLFFD